MSKQAKDNRKARTAKNSAAYGTIHPAGVFLVVLIVALLFGIWLWNSGSTLFVRADTSSGTMTPANKAEFEKLTGQWRRPDGGYILAIKGIAADGSIDAGYFNPNPIHVAEAKASYDGEAAKLVIELRDVNYPGSTYTLTYDPKSDQLNGLYYQAVEKQRFPVFFTRLK